MVTDPITLVLIYNEQKDSFFPIEEGQQPDPEANTYLIIDESAKKSTLSFTPSSTLIEKRTIERRVNSFIKTGYKVPNKKGLRIGAGLPLTKVDPKSDDLPEILLTSGHKFGKKSKVKAKSKAKAPRAEEKTSPLVESKSIPEHISEPKSTHVPKDQGLLISPEDEHLFILGQFINMYIEKGFQILVYKNNEGKFELKTIKEDSTYFIEGNQLFFK